MNTDTLSPMDVQESAPSVPMIEPVSGQSVDLAHLAECYGVHRFVFAPDGIVRGQSSGMEIDLPGYVGVIFATGSVTQVAQLSAPVNPQSDNMETVRIPHSMVERFKAMLGAAS